MELRHLRYFIAVAEEGSLTLAAEKRLHTAQPSLSRQIRDLEYEVGVQLMSRSVHGIAHVFGRIAAPLPGGQRRLGHGEVGRAGIGKPWLFCVLFVSLYDDFLKSNRAPTLTSRPIPLMQEYLKTR